MGSSAATLQRRAAAVLHAQEMVVLPNISDLDSMEEVRLQGALSRSPLQTQKP